MRSTVTPFYNPLSFQNASQLGFNKTSTVHPGTIEQRGKNDFTRFSGQDTALTQRVGSVLNQSATGSRQNPLDQERMRQKKDIYFQELKNQEKNIRAGLLFAAWSETARNMMRVLLKRTQRQASEQAAKVARSSAEDKPSGETIPLDFKA